MGGRVAERSEEEKKIEGGGYEQIRVQLPLSYVRYAQMIPMYNSTARRQQYKLITYLVIAILYVDLSNLIAIPKQLTKAARHCPNTNMLVLYLLIICMYEWILLLHHIV